VRLKYIPIPSSWESQNMRKEQGRYEIMVKIKDKDSRDYGKYLMNKPTNNWVEDNFTSVRVWE
jgi:hypothetical protein